MTIWKNTLEGYWNVWEEWERGTKKNQTHDTQTQLLTVEKKKKKTAQL